MVKVISAATQLTGDVDKAISGIAMSRWPSDGGRTRRGRPGRSSPGLHPGSRERGARLKVTPVGPDEIFHRYLTPKWAFLPTSGAGAAIDGGRFNRAGVEALYLHLYLSRSTQTALDEYKQAASDVPPARDSTRTSGMALGRNGIVPAPGRSH